jgi:LacI family transcriptional regulator
MSTIQDVAKRAGVGASTVSRVISGRGFVAKATKAKVQKAIDALGYRPAPAARKLRVGLSQTIGVFLPVIRGSFYAPILHGLYTVLRARGRHMVVAFGQTIENEREEAMAGAEFLVEHGCDGLIVMGTALKQKDVEGLLTMKPRLAVLNRTFARYSDFCFAPDHEAAGALAARTLLEAGHRDIAVIEGPSISADNVQRMSGFFGELTRNGFDIEAIPRFRGDFLPAGGALGVQTLLNNKARFTALFCANDEMAMGALSYLNQTRVSVPEEISIMGYDGLDISTYASPPLTTIRIPWTELVLNAVNYLLNACYHTRLPVQHDVPAQVQWRGSLARLDESRRR